MDAEIYRKNGTLIVDFRTPIDKKNLHRDVCVWQDPNEHSVFRITSKQANFIYDADDISQYSWETYYNSTNRGLDVVLPTYLEEYDTTIFSWWERPVFEMFSDKWRISRKEIRIKSGWVELKNTNVPRDFTTTNIIIYK